MSKAFWFLAGAISLALVATAIGLALLMPGTRGFSAREQPTALERMVARKARSLALPNDARARVNPIGNSPEVLAEARAHWADHCATCHANDGSGQVPVGQQMYPPPPDMRQESTQRLTDGELFFIIENGIRLSGMPAWGGGAGHGTEDSWKLVHFIRHLPALSPSEIREMEKLNPKTEADRAEERAEEQFLSGQPVREPPKKAHHH